MSVIFYAAESARAWTTAGAAGRLGLLLLLAGFWPLIAAAGELPQDGAGGDEKVEAGQVGDSGDVEPPADSNSLRTQTAVQDAAEESSQSAAQESLADNPREMRLQLWDGTVITGDVGIDNLHVQTRFGKLEVPVASIVKMSPGLNSLPALRQKIDGLVENLGDRDFKVREQSLEALMSMGPMIVDYIATVGDGGSAERKKHLLNLVEELNAARDELLDGFDGGTMPQILAEEDAVSTGEFTIVGRIEEQMFRLKTKFGELEIGLGDIRQADRMWLEESVTVRRTVEMASRDFFQTSPKETGIRVRRGDEIRIKASGKINWTSWGNMVSTPDGIPNHGLWESMNCGMLAARIGKSGGYIPVGEEHGFVAQADGELILGIAMLDNLAGQQGYQWDGKYEVKLVVVKKPEGK